MTDFLQRHWRDIRDFASLAVGLLGLLLTLSAMKYAKKAQSAAQAAQSASEATADSMAKDSLIHALGEVRRLGSELSTLLGLNAHSSALVRAKDMGEGLRYAIQRWDLHLADMLPELREAQAQLDSLIRKLTKALNEPLTTQEAKRLNVICQKVVSSVINSQAAAEERGKKNA